MSKNVNPPQPNKKGNNPHASAAGAYDQHAQAHTPDQRELEARVLLKAARQLQALKDDWDNMTPELLDDTLRYNRQIWLMFVDTAMEDTSPDRPQELRNNIANLGMYIFNHSVDILASPAKSKLDILIDINREIAAGLMTRPKTETKTETKPGETPAGS